MSDNALMSIERAERMIGSIKKVVEGAAKKREDKWDEVLKKIVYGYRRRLVRESPSLFQLLYGVMLRPLSSDESCGGKLD